MRANIKHANQSISKKDFLENMENKLKNPTFIQDIHLLLPERAKSFDHEIAYKYVKKILLEKL